MSSTNRGGQREASDYYITPQWAIMDFLVAFNYDVPFLGVQHLSILDPCAGGDKNNDMAYPKAINNFSKWPYRTIHTLDIRPDSKAQVIGDYLTADISKLFPIEGKSPDIIITNPPFSHALEVTQKALQDVAPNGYVIMLQRLNWLGAQKRFSFWQHTLPSHIYVHHQRIAFTPDGKTDSIEYAHFVFQQGINPTHAKLKVI